MSLKCPHHLAIGSSGACMLFEEARREGMALLIHCLGNVLLFAQRVLLLRNNEWLKEKKNKINVGYNTELWHQS